MSEDRKQLQVVLPRANGVSSAIWPASARRCIATSREAQRQRYMIINGKKWMLFPLSLVVLVTMGMSAAIVAALSWHLWYLLPVGAMLLLLGLLNAHAEINARSIFSHLRAQLQPSRSSHALYGKQTVAKSTTGSKVVSKERYSQSYATPRTPMPEHPLVRVLETIDLSRANAEPFVDGETQDTAGLLLKRERSLVPAKIVH